MNTSLVCLAIALTAPAVDNTPSVYTPTRVFDTVVRAQGGVPYDEIPMVNGATPMANGAPQTFAAPMAVPDGTMIVPGQPGGPPFGPTSDPFLAQQYGLSPNGNGVNGPQPYRLNRWVSRYEFGVLPSESTSRGLGKFGVFEFDADWRYATPTAPGWIFSFAQQFNIRSWDGPTGSAMAPTTALPGSVFRFGWDLTLETPSNNANPWGVSITFNPSLNSDMESSLSSNAWNFDGYGMLFYRATPVWTWVAGAGFWDRVNDQVVPYAGFIYTPSPRWEWRAVLPNPRVSYHMGNAWGIPTWFYARGEYHVEAYEIQLQTTGRREQVEIEDWRILMGLRFDNGYYASFIEAGWVFEREVNYKLGTPGFDVSSGFIARAGFRF